MPKIESIWIRHVVARGGKIRQAQRFHLEGNLNFGLWKEIWKEIAFGMKLGGNIVIRREMRRKFYFISLFLRASRTGPQNPYIVISTKPHTQGIISQTLLSVGRKDPTQPRSQALVVERAWVRGWSWTLWLSCVCAMCVSFSYPEPFLRAVR